MKSFLTYLVVTTLVLSGCRTSDQQIGLTDKVLWIGAIKSSLPALTNLNAVDSRGELMAVATGEELRIQSIKTMETISSQKVIAGEPFMFRHDSKAIFCSDQNEIVELDFAGKTTKLLVGDYSTLHSTRNASCSITVLGNEDDGFLAINFYGKFMRSKVRPLFDQFGNAWARVDGAWLMLGSQQPPERRSRPPKYLVNDQIILRGSMQLVEQKRTLIRKGSEAFVSTIWLDHAAAIGEKRSAVVFAGLDVYYFGFVPKQDLICVLTFDGTYFIPIETTPK
jgi:hypothetical protein